MVCCFWVYCFALDFERPLSDLVEVLKFTGELVLYGNLVLSVLCPVHTATDSVLCNLMPDHTTLAELILYISCKLYLGLWLEWVTEEKLKKNPTWIVIH